jgi:tellurite resistance protein
MWTTESDKAMAIARIKQVIWFATDDGALDQEEQDHLAEIIRLLEERVPAECFAGLGDFKGTY